MTPVPSTSKFLNININDEKKALRDALIAGIAAIGVYISPFLNDSAFNFSAIDYNVVWKVFVIAAITSSVRRFLVNYQDSTKGFSY